MRYTTMKATGWKISAIGFGSWAIADPKTWGPQDEEAALKAIRASLDSGVNVFDTAAMYGDGYSEQLVGRGLGTEREKVYVATKVPSTAFRPAALRAACEESLRNLGTDWIDLYQLHWPHPTIPVAETLGVLKTLREEGKIRAFGVSNFGVRDLAPALKPARFDVVTNQLAYNLLFRAIEHEILPLCLKEKLDVICYSPLMSGLLTGKFKTADAVPEGRARTRHFSSRRPQTRHGEDGAEEETFDAIRHIDAIAREVGEPIHHVALSWLLSQGGVLCAIAGARSAYQAKSNARAGNLVLPLGMVERLAKATEPLKKMMGRNPDAWQSESRIH